MKKYNTVFFAIAIVSQLSLFGMDKPQAFHHFTCLDKELQKAVVVLVDDLSYIGQTNKDWYAEVKKQQMDHIVDMHRKQNPQLAKPNIPPFVFFVNPFYDGRQCSGKCAIDPNSRIFYQESTKEKYPLDCGVYHDKFHMHGDFDDKYDCITPTNLLIACLTQNERETRRLLQFYPLVERHIIGNPQLEKLYKDPFTQLLFLQALYVSRMIPNNKATCILLEYLKRAHTSEESLINKRRKQKEELREAANQEVQQIRFIAGLQMKHSMCMKHGLNIFKPFTKEEEEKARKEFEEMILSASK